MEVYGFRFYLKDYPIKSYDGNQYIFILIRRYSNNLGKLLSIKIIDMSEQSA